MLARKGVAEEVFTREEARWTKAIVDTSSNEDNTLVEVFGLAFAAEQRRLRREKPSLPSLGELPAPAPEPNASEALPLAEASTQEIAAAEQPPLAPPLFTPTYLRSTPSAAVPAAVAAPPELSVDDTVMGGVPMAKPLPFEGHLKAPPPPQPVSPSPDAGETVMVPLPQEVRTMIAKARDVDPDATQKPFRNPLPVIPFAGRSTPERIREIAGPPAAARRCGRNGCGAPAGPRARRPERKDPDLSLREYAALRAALSAEGEDSAEVLARFGLTAAEKKSLQQAYFELFRAEPVLRTRFEAILQDEIRKHRRGGGSER